MRQNLKSFKVDTCFTNIEHFRINSGQTAPGIYMICWLCHSKMCKAKKKIMCVSGFIPRKNRVGR